jgi:hypothetical protein
MEPEKERAAQGKQKASERSQEGQKAGQDSEDGEEEVQDNGGAEEKGELILNSNKGRIQILLAADADTRVACI